MHTLRNDSDLVHVRIAILAAKDAHIVLTASDTVSSEDAVYEIVLGAGSNTYCEIRRQFRTSSLKSSRYPNVLSAVDPVAFLIRVTVNGLIEITYEGEDSPLIAANATETIPLKYIAFGSWGNTEAKFFYDCPNTLCKYFATLSCLF